MIHDLKVMRNGNDFLLTKTKNYRTVRSILKQIQNSEIVFYDASSYQL